MGSVKNYLPKEYFKSLFLIKIQLFVKYFTIIKILNMFKSRIILLMLFVLPVFTILAQQRSITGTVTDETGEPIPSVLVLIKGSTAGTTTDLDGTYSISVPGEVTLIFNMIGFNGQEISTEGKIPLM